MSLTRLRPLHHEPVAVPGLGAFARVVPTGLKTVEFAFRHLAENFGRLAQRRLSLSRKHGQRLKDQPASNVHLDDGLKLGVVSFVRGDNREFHFID